MKYLVAMFLLMSAMAASCLIKENGPAADVPAILRSAGQLMQEGKYDAAMRLYDRALLRTPENEEAQRERDNCRMMLEPAEPVQHLAPPPQDERFKELMLQRDEATTPWERRRTERSMERLSVQYTEEEFRKDGQKLRGEAAAIIEQAAKKMAQGATSEKVYREAGRALALLQERGDRAWKGHGLEVLAPSLEQLRKVLLGNKFPDKEKGPHGALGQFKPAIPRQANSE